jgi:hypothetical protein
MSKKLAHEIRTLAQERFPLVLVEEFIQTFLSHLGHSVLLESLLQISTDEGDELEIGFFTIDKIVDVTLSRGKIYSYAYPLASVRQVIIEDRGEKSVLRIAGEKKFDYNVVKPNSLLPLERYRKSLCDHLSL